jgi:GrpB-like predicted nucleotidyltransferase (UPF0157 family)
MEAITIKPHCEGWSDEFRVLAREIASIMPPGSSIFHIGSTAVPGLDAKDVIDIQLTVPSLRNFNPSTGQRIGFDHVARITSDHCPPNLQLADEELAKYFLRSRGRPANLHVREAGRFNQRYALLCRDYLRAHPICAAAYSQIKRRLARYAPEDVEFYYEIKDPVFDIIMEGAYEWAKTVSWSQPTSDYA